MAHDVATEIQGGVGALVKMFVDFAVELAEFEMTSSASLVHKVNTQVNVLGALTAAKRALRPGDARFIVGKDKGRCSVRIAKISQEFAKIDHLLNHAEAEMNFALAEDEATVG